MAGVLDDGNRVVYHIFIINLGQNFMRQTRALSLRNITHLNLYMLFLPSYNKVLVRSI